MKRTLALLLISSGLFVAACGDGSDSSSSGAGGSTGQGGGQGGSTTATGTGGTLGTGGMSGTVGTGGRGGMMMGSNLGPKVDTDLMLSGNIDMPQSTTVAPGVTLTFAAGSTIHAGPGASLIVEGTVVANGQQGSAVVFQGKTQGGAGEWGGIELKSGANATLTHIAIHDAALAFHAGAGSNYAVDYALVDTSKQILSLEANGTFGHGTLHALGSAQSGSPVMINSASPTISDTLVDNANSGVDHIVVGGASSGPTFDHMEVTGCHCAFHFNQGKLITVKNAYVHDNAYGMMVLGSLQTQVVASNFVNNGNNLGVCTSGDVTSVGNYFSGAVFDSSCQGQANTAQSQTLLTDVGPRP